jgi:hypothetical protein
MSRKRSSLFLTLVACGTLSIGLFACGGGGYSKPPSTAPPYMPPPSHALRTPVNTPSAPGTGNISNASTPQAQAGR